MKKNVPKFVLANNEAASPGAAYIVHTQEPSFIAEIKRFSDITERNRYLSENADVEIVVVNPFTLVEIKKYLDAPDRDKRKKYLHDRISRWLIANYLNSTDQT